MRTRPVAALVLVAACGAFINHADPTWGLAGKAVPVDGSHGMVVSGHPLASAVGVQILKDGGNAIDAAVAVGFALEAVHPEAGNIGGGGFIVFRDSAGNARALDYRETAPAAATHNMYLDSAGNPTEASITGYLASGVPGSVAGMYEAWKAHGHLPWARLIAPAIALAEGHVLDEHRARSIDGERERLGQFPASTAAFLVDGHAPAAGSTVRHPDLRSE